MAPDDRDSNPPATPEGSTARSPQASRPSTHFQSIVRESDDPRDEASTRYRPLSRASSYGPSYGE